MAKVSELRLQHQSFHNTSYDLLTSLISFRIDWFDLPAVQGTLKSLIQYHSSKASILWWSNSHIHTWPLEYSGSDGPGSPSFLFLSSWIRKASKALPLGSIFWPLLTMKFSLVSDLMLPTISIPFNLKLLIYYFVPVKWKWQWHHPTLLRTWRGYRNSLDHS